VKLLSFHYSFIEPKEEPDVNPTEEVDIKSKLESELFEDPI
jgi:hypothetical protein